MTMDALKPKVVREPRRQLHKQPAWMTVDDGRTNRECFVLDVSPGGARIVTDVAIDVRDKFGLALVRDRPKHQSCEVVWRRGKTYGVKFLIAGKAGAGPINDLSAVEPHAQAELFDAAQRVKAEA
ncbi:PilZ domain-containing protein [Bradyrhizobium sp. AUGA SZCCT0169]|nr:PilZ domain-containing protein [Bradyrhizobium sp. AUGA SZCCT0169]